MLDLDAFEQLNNIVCPRAQQLLWYLLPSGAVKGQSVVDIPSQNY